MQDNAIPAIDGPNPRPCLRRVTGNSPSRWSSLLPNGRPLPQWRDACRRPPRPAPLLRPELGHQRADLDRGRPCAAAVLRRADARGSDTVGPLAAAQRTRIRTFVSIRDDVIPTAVRRRGCRRADLGIGVAVGGHCSPGRAGHRVAALGRNVPPPAVAWGPHLADRPELGCWAPRSPRSDSQAPSNRPRPIIAIPLARSSSWPDFRGRRRRVLQPVGPEARQRTHRGRGDRSSRLLLAALAGWLLAETIVCRMGLLT